MDSIPAPVGISLVTTVDQVELSILANTYLTPHSLAFDVMSDFEDRTKRGVTATMAHGFELLEIAINNPLAFQALIVGIAGATGFSITRLFGKAVESVAGELGKDLYKWLKATVVSALHSSKEKNLNTGRVEGSTNWFRLILHVPLFEHENQPIVLRVYCGQIYAALDNTGTLRDNGIAEELIKSKLEYLGSTLVPFISELLAEQRKRRLPMPDRIILSTRDIDDEPANCEWNAGVDFADVDLDKSGISSISISHKTNLNNQDILEIYERIRTAS
jgi:hypothetical protein